MDRDTIRNLICLLLFLVFAGLTVLFTLVDINVGVVKLSSVKGIIAKRQELKELETSLEEAETNYSTSKETLDTSKKNFETAKKEYDAISDETIELIREATTEENYDIEFMWIKLGNYATANNLTIVMVEPGGQMQVTTQSSENTDSTQNTTSETTTNTANSNSTESTDTTSNATANSTTTTSSNADTLLTITLEGSYLNVSDFIFEVENDKELRFKLDNIEMTYVQGTTIRTKFDVKNVIIKK